MLPRTSRQFTAAADPPFAFLYGEPAPPRPSSIDIKVIIFRDSIKDFFALHYHATQGAKNAALILQRTISLVTEPFGHRAIRRRAGLDKAAIAGSYAKAAAAAIHGEEAENGGRLLA